MVARTAQMTHSTNAALKCKGDARKGSAKKASLQRHCLKFAIASVRRTKHSTRGMHANMKCTWSASEDSGSKIKAWVFDLRLKHSNLPVTCSSHMLHVRPPLYDLLGVHFAGLSRTGLLLAKHYS